MTPDVEQERAWRERIEVLFDGVPAPDADRLAMALVTARARRRRSRHRVLAVLAGAMLLGGGIAMAAWWASDYSRTEPEHAPPIRSKPAPEQPVQQEKRSDDSTAGPTNADNAIIYRRAD